MFFFFFVFSQVLKICFFDLNRFMTPYEISKQKIKFSSRPGDRGGEEGGGEREETHPFQASSPLFLLFLFLRIFITFFLSLFIFHFAFSFSFLRCSESFFGLNCFTLSFIISVKKSIFRAVWEGTL